MVWLLVIDELLLRPLLLLLCWCSHHWCFVQCALKAFWGITTCDRHLKLFTHRKRYWHNVGGGSLNSVHRTKSVSAMMKCVCLVLCGGSRVIKLCIIYIVRVNDIEWQGFQRNAKFCNGFSYALTINSISVVAYIVQHKSMHLRLSFAKRKLFIAWFSSAADGCAQTKWTMKAIQTMIWTRVCGKRLENCFERTEIEHRWNEKWSVSRLRIVAVSTRSNGIWLQRLYSWLGWLYIVFH